jgi:secreted trypsin-like serine protease
MSELFSAIKVLDDIKRKVEDVSIQQQLEEVKDILGRLQAQGEAAALEAPAAVAPAVIPPSAPEVEIFGGQETDEFPDCCAVGNELGWFCTGTLIAPNLVVTARHCKMVTQVFLKGNDVTEPSKGEIIGVVAQHVHPDVDLRLLVLEKASKEVAPRQVARGAQVESAKQATAVGFGTIDQHGEVGYGRKRSVDVPITTLDCKYPTDENRYGCVPGKELVAGHRGLQRDSCRGDSGGPLYIQNGEGEYLLLGATSRGSSDAFAVCGDGGIYVRVDLCLDWIREETGADL